MQARAKRQLRLWLHKIHRQAGILSALIVCLVTFTGIFLNHISELELDQAYPQGHLVLLPYQAVIDSNPASLSTVIKWQTLAVSVKNHRIFVDGELRAAGCQTLLEAAATDHELLLMCEQQWVLLAADGKLLDLYEPSFFDIPPVFDLVADNAGFYLINSASDEVTSLALDFDLFAVDEVPVPEFLMPALQSTQMQTKVNSAITWERVLLDLHSGRWFGAWGVWVFDIAAVLLLILALSGTWIWLDRQMRVSRRR